MKRIHAEDDSHSIAAEGIDFEEGSQLSAGATEEKRRFEVIRDGARAFPAVTGGTLDEIKVIHPLKAKRWA